MTNTIQGWMFPLRVVQMDSGFELWTRLDLLPGSRNNFALVGGIQHETEARRICEVLNRHKLNLICDTDQARIVSKQGQEGRYSELPPLGKDQPPGS